MCKRVCNSQKDLESTWAQLKLTACPHCRQVGYLNRHGHLHGYSKESQQAKSVRGSRVYCSNRGSSRGCGRTFTIWTASHIKRLFLTADELWDFLLRAVRSGNKMQAFRSIKCGMSDSAPYRIWKRFQLAQSGIRTALHALCLPPTIVSDRPEELTLAQLQAAFKDSVNPIAAFQANLQRSFI